MDGDRSSLTVMSVSVSPDPAFMNFAAEVPLIVGKRWGGRFEELSFMAGYQLGQLARDVAKLEPGEVATAAVIPDLRNQVDLLAMFFDYPVRLETTGQPQVTKVWITRPTKIEAP